MPNPCPHCGAAPLTAVAEVYQTRVREPEADPAALAPLAPPLRRSVLHGTACISLFFMAALLPGFVSHSRSLQVMATFLALGCVSFVAWVRSRRTDRAAMAAYHRRRMCAACGREA
ncbi:MAG TPA: hypothetical protein VK188_13500 [Holophaga sp.]|nr:hypothetical protein [Holophaga sp.]